MEAVVAYFNLFFRRVCGKNEKKVTQGFPNNTYSTTTLRNVLFAAVQLLAELKQKRVHVCEYQSFTGQQAGCLSTQANDDYSSSSSSVGPGD
jgi:hypothetical protein